MTAVMPDIYKPFDQGSLPFLPFCATALLNTLIPTLAMFKSIEEYLQLILKQTLKQPQPCP